MLILSDKEILYKGGKTIVYQHPDFTKMLVKVPRPLDYNLPFIKSIRPARFKFGKMREWAFQHNCLISAISRCDRLPRCFSNFYGYCDTDLGIGWVVEKIEDDLGNIAPTFRDTCVNSNKKEKLSVLVDNFFAELKELKVFAGDLHTRNVVVAGDLERLVLIDGLGENTLIKLKTYVGPLRDYAMDKRKQRFILKFHNFLDCGVINKNYFFETKCGGAYALIFFRYNFNRFGFLGDMLKIRSIPAEHLQNHAQVL